MSAKIFISCPQSQALAIKEHCEQRPSNEAYYGIDSTPDDTVNLQAEDAREQGIVSFVGSLPASTKVISMVYVKDAVIDKLGLKPWEEGKRNGIFEKGPGKKLWKEGYDAWSLATRLHIARPTAQIQLKYVSFEDLQKAGFDPDTTADQKAGNMWDPQGVCKFKWAFDNKTKYMVYKPQCDASGPGNTQVMFVSCPFMDDGVKGGWQQSLESNCNGNDSHKYCIVDQGTAKLAETDDKSFVAAWKAMVLVTVNNLPKNTETIQLILVKGGGPGCAYERQNVLPLCEALRGKKPEAKILAKYVHFHQLQKVGFNADLVRCENANDTWDKYGKANFTTPEESNSHRGFIQFTG